MAQALWARIRELAILPGVTLLTLWARLAFGTMCGSTDTFPLGGHTGLMGLGCSPTGWSAVTSAMANATLAGVLAGFMINALILLLSNKPDASNQLRYITYVQSASLLFAAFVALGLDSYLFGLVTGESTAIAGAFSTCRRAWTEAMFAAGLLGVGAVAVIAGFVFLFAAYSIHQVETMCNFLRPGVAFAVLILIYATAWSYLFAVFQGHIPYWVKIFYIIFAVIGTIIVLVVITAGITTRNFDNPVAHFFKANGPLHITRAVWLAISSSVVYSLLSVVWASAVSITPAHFWNTTHFWVRVVIVATIFWVLVVSLIPLLVLLLRAVPVFPAEAPKVDHP